MTREDDIRLPRSLLEYYARIGAEVLNFRRAMIRQYRGAYYLEKCLIRITADGEVRVSQRDHDATEEEKEKIKADWLKFDMPRTIEATEAVAQDLAESLDGQTFVFRSRTSGNVIMVQQRTVTAEGNRLFVPWTRFSDGRWRPMEPDGPLPLWKPERDERARIMVHEGAKAAQTAQRIASGEERPDHPWREELAEYDHWGMIGGALAPHRTDYKELQDAKPHEVVYVCDNDEAGKRALREVSRNYRRSLRGIVFDERWTAGWDMHDPVPERFFGPGGRYNGPCLRDMHRPATWATQTIQPEGKKGRPSIVLSENFVSEWFHSVIPEVYAHRDWPNEMYSAGEFNSFVRPFSDVDDTARLLKMHDVSKGVRLRYTPVRDKGIFVDDEGVVCLNTHVRAAIKSEEGDVGPFLRFMEHLVPSEVDRENLARWITTLVARPDVRMLYGVLLISERQGVGKGTLAEKILAPLVGFQNTSIPTETEIVDSEFNYWASHKRLAIVHEIYAGHSSKAYNKLKSIITDDHVTINKKYQASYQIQNWLHVLACSNSKNALRLSSDDRRWFVPEVTEEVRSPAYWVELNDWLIRCGGLGKIKRWAEDRAKDPANLVMRGESAPWSSTKKAVVEEGWSDGMKLVAATLDLLKDQAAQENKVVLLLDTELVRLIREIVYEGRLVDKLERPLTIRKLAKSCGWFVREEKIVIRKWGGLNSHGARLITNDWSASRAGTEELRQMGVPLNVVEEVTKSANM